MDRRRFLRVATGACAALANTGALAAGFDGAELAAGGRYQMKMAAFDQDHPEDRWLIPKEIERLRQVVAHLRRVQATVGYGHFHMLGFDGMLRVGRDYSRVGSFGREETEFLEEIFFTAANRYGFFGEKVLTRLTDEIPRSSAVRLRQNGQYLLKGESLVTYRRVKSAIGDSLELTSGARGIAKQLLLFLGKALEAEGNLSRASRSLAPPGYSFHAVGDFDVGQRGLGRLNFTRRFADCDVYRRLVDLGFVEVRYPVGNPYGVRYEPWHVRVV